MEHIRREVTEKLHRTNQWDFYFADRSVCVLDIETTGLDRRRNRFILGGLYDPAQGILHQVFAERPEEEPAALAAFLALLHPFDIVVTYNGRHFDLPFLRERARRYAAGGAASNRGKVPAGRLQGTEGADRTPAAGETGRSRGGASDGAAGSLHPYDGYDLDLYQVVNGHSPIRRLLPNLKQKTVESYMGLWTDRSDEISGAESVQLYEHFAATGDPEARRQILLHNSDDVLQLTRLLRVLDKSDLHRAMYHMGFPVGSPGRRWQIKKIRLQGGRIQAEGIQGFRPVSYMGFGLGDYPLQSRFDGQAGTFQLEIPILRRSGIAAADLQAAGLPQEGFQRYPGFGSGFLVVEGPEGIQYREVNHLVRALVARLEAECPADP